MTPAEHIERAEQLLEALRKDSRDWDDTGKVVTALEVIGHVGIAVAVELGAPHVSGDTTAASSG